MLPNFTKVIDDFNNKKEVSDLTFILEEKQEEEKKENENVQKKLKKSKRQKKEKVERIFNCHKSLFMLSSPFWKDVLQTEDQKEKLSVHLDSVDPKVFGDYISFVYSHKPPKLETAAQYFHLYSLARQFKTYDLDTLCFENINKTLTIDNALEYFDYSLQSRSTTLVSKMKSYIEKHSFQILSQKGVFNGIPEHTLVQLLRIDQFPVPEIEMFRRIIERGIYLCKEKFKIEPSRRNITSSIFSLSKFVYFQLILPVYYAEIIEHFDFEYFEMNTPKSKINHNGSLLNLKNTKWIENISPQALEPKQKKKKKNTISIIFQPNQNNVLLDHPSSIISQYKDTKSNSTRMKISNSIAVNAYHQTEGHNWVKMKSSDEEYMAQSNEEDDDDYDQDHVDSESSEYEGGEYVNLKRKRKSNNVFGVTHDDDLKDFIIDDEDEDKDEDEEEDEDEDEEMESLEMKIPKIKYQKKKKPKKKEKKEREEKYKDKENKKEKDSNQEHTEKSLVEKLKDLKKQFPNTNKKRMQRKVPSDLKSNEFQTETIIRKGKAYVKKVSKGMAPRPKPRKALRKIKVMYCTTESKPLRIENICTSIRWQGIENIEICDLQESTPTLETLGKYDVVFLSTVPNKQLLNQKEFGDTLARYIDNGGGLVLTTYCSMAASAAGKPAKTAIQGRIVSKHYLPLSLGKVIRAGKQHPRTLLGEITDKEHILVRGVNEFEGGGVSHRLQTSFVCKKNERGAVVAYLNDGLPFIAWKQKMKTEKSGRVVALNMNPLCGTSEVHGNGKFWLVSSNGFEIISNAIEFAANKVFN
ncbi:pep-cterm sorting domain-containing protein [Anaeramoeba flamelloides]|uniref:Pep-cterm sorting domain-containing protein n=1 Tax=Anaeramoeba flamelloides TaxID=1746091 RepID=A0ABQ8XKC5_9EUKA|nr:pep-cterm sorting domain-containing protein [Anaeramoeba flamelloides]